MCSGVILNPHILSARHLPHQTDNRSTRHWTTQRAASDYSSPHARVDHGHDSELVDIVRQVLPGLILRPQPVRPPANICLQCDFKENRGVGSLASGIGAEGIGYCGRSTLMWKSFSTAFITSVGQSSPPHGAWPTVLRLARSTASVQRAYNSAMGAS